MATTIRIISTWWYPKNGTHPVVQSKVRHSHSSQQSYRHVVVEEEYLRNHPSCILGILNLDLELLPLPIVLSYDG